MDAILKSLGVDLTSVVWHAINFLILLLVLQRYMYRPILKMLDDRAAQIRDSLAQADSVRAETARIEAASRGILDEARKQSQELLATANRNSERIVSEARQVAQQEAERIVERARGEMSREREQAFQELRLEVVDIAVLAASHVIRRSLDDASHRELVREYLAESSGSQN